jgi:hypothetical protein
MIGEDVHPWDCPSIHADQECATVLTTAEQLLTGITWGRTETEARCIDCGRILREGERGVVYAYRTAEATQWEVARQYCRDCGPDRIDVPTLGTSELLVTAAIGTVSDVREQSHRWCLLAVERIDASPPTEGTRP